MVRNRSTQNVGHASTRGFTLIELLVVIAIMGLLVGILLPSLRRARLQSKAVVCGTRLRALGEGWNIYANFNHGLSVPARLPFFSPGGFANPANRYRISTGEKYRPRWPALMQTAVGVPALGHPKTTRNRQDYSGGVYVCPSAANWTDERNSGYGYNYQFMGSHRIDEGRIRNLPVPLSRIRASAGTVLITDSNGSAAAFPTREREEYANDDRDVHRRGNYGWIIDPPRLEPGSSHAGGDGSPRSAPDARHPGGANALFVDGHISRSTLQHLGYQVESNGVVAETGPLASNRYFSGTGRDDSPP